MISGAPPSLSEFSFQLALFVSRYRIDPADKQTAVVTKIPAIFKDIVRLFQWRIAVRTQHSPDHYLRRPLGGRAARASVQVRLSSSILLLALLLIEPKVTRRACHDPLHSCNLSQITIVCHKQSAEFPAVVEVGVVRRVTQVRILGFLTCQLPMLSCYHLRRHIPTHSLLSHLGK